MIELKEAEAKVREEKDRANDAVMASMTMKVEVANTKRLVAEGVSSFRSYIGTLFRYILFAIMLLA